MELLPFLLLLHQILAVEPTPKNPSFSTIFPNPKPQNFKSLPAGTKISILLFGHSLFITTAHSGVPISLNNVKITSGWPIYDDEFLIIFEIQNFFNLNFHLLIVIIPVALAGSIFYLYFNPTSRPSTSSPYRSQKFDSVPKPNETCYKKKSGFFFFEFFFLEEKGGKW